MSREIDVKWNKEVEEIKEQIIEERISSIDFERIFIIDSINEQNKEYTYLQFFAFVVSAIDFMNASEAREIIILLDNSFEMIIIYFACMLCEKVFIPIDIQKKALEIEAIIKEYPNAEIISDEKYMMNLKHYKYKNCHELQLAKKEVKITKEQVIDLFYKAKWEEDFQITYTSGSTGENKGVVHSLYNLVLCACIYSDKYLKRKDKVFAHFWSMSYMAGLENSVMVPFFSGSKIVLMERFSMKTAFSFWDKAVRYGVNVFWLSPTMLALLEKIGDQKVKDYFEKSNPLFLIVTAPLPMNLRERFEEKYNIKIWANYGLTETLFLSGEDEDSADGNGGVGKILEGIQLKISRDNEILIKVPWMFKRYTNIDSKTYFDGEYYKTGDLGKVSSNGVLHITGRKKNLIIKGGMNISPRLIEDVLEKRFPSLELAAFGDKGKSGEEIICLAYVTKDGIRNSELEKKIHNMVLVDLGINYKIDCYFAITTIPHNANGKVNLNKLKSIRSQKHEK